MIFFGYLDSMDLVCVQSFQRGILQVLLWGSFLLRGSVDGLKIFRFFCFGVEGSADVYAICLFLCVSFF